jgi:Uma2 family endonuclease
MATVPETCVLGNPNYPTSDGKPMAETDDHRTLMEDLIRILKRWFQSHPRVYVSGNMLLFYIRGNKRRHISPDVFVVKGVPKGSRLNYILWEEKKGPCLVIELTSSSTRREDTDRKYRFYRDVLKVKEYFLFDPHGDYLQPQLQGYRLRNGEYQPMRLLAGRLPSRELGLHLEPDGNVLRLYDPATGRWLPTEEERSDRAERAQRQAEADRQREQQARRQAEADREREKESRQRVEMEVEHLRREVEVLRRRLSESS